MGFLLGLASRPHCPDQCPNGSHGEVGRKRSQCPQCVSQCWQSQRLRILHIAGTPGLPKRLGLERPNWQDLSNGYRSIRPLEHVENRALDFATIIH